MDAKNIVFLFPAHGSEHMGMTRELYQHFPGYRQVFDYCAERLTNHLDIDLRHLIVPPSQHENDVRKKLNQTYVVQPALFAVEYALARFVMDLGIKPASMLGYSVGEFTAACLAGVFSLDDGLQLVAERGRLIQSQPPGRMLAIALSEDDCRVFENEDVSLATVLGENHCVLSGTSQGIAAVKDLLHTKKVAIKELSVSHAFHSTMMSPIVAPFKQIIKNISLSSPGTPFVSCVTGANADDQVLTADYWANHLRHTIRWYDVVTMLAKNPQFIFLEIGPNNLIGSLVRSHPLLRRDQRVFSICNAAKSTKSSIHHFLEILSTLSSKGIVISWPKLSSDGASSDFTRDEIPVQESQADQAYHDQEKDDLLYALESEICNSFAEILKVPNIQANDNFLDLGGNSLMAMQLIARLRDKFGVSIPIQSFFEASTPDKTACLLIDMLNNEKNETVSKQSQETSKFEYSIKTADKKDIPSETAQQCTYNSKKNKFSGYSLFFFSGAEDDISDAKYDFVLNAARFADEHDFHAVWTPERHFNKFGGLYASPSLLGAAIATTTQRIGIRAGSVVAPLNHPLRIAEEWSMVDNLSHGRVGVAFGSGFQPRDFIFAPENFQQRKQIMFDNIKTIQDMWKGQPYQGIAPGGQAMDVFMWPKPVQSSLPFWLATTREPETFEQAGKLGAGVLTALLRLTIPELQERISIYREARKTAGLDPDTGEVTLMLHTFVGSDIDYVRRYVTKPFREYLRSHMEHTRNIGADQTRNGHGDLLTLEDEEKLLDFAFERYFNTASLFGTPESCQSLIEQLIGIGVTEIGCLIDFGVEPEVVMDSIKFIHELQQRTKALNNEIMQL